MLDEMTVALPIPAGTKPKNCDYCQTEFEPRTQGKPGRFCRNEGVCRKAYYAKAWRKGAQAIKRRDKPRSDFEEERQKPEFQKGVAEILAWAEAQHPATPEAWGIEAAGEVVKKAG